MSKKFQIAIDGPVAAGKGTVSRLLAEKLGYLYVDTGAMYRAVALIIKKNNLDPKNISKIVEIVKNSKIELLAPKKSQEDGRLVTVLLDGEDVSWKIRTPEISVLTSQISQIPEIRSILVKKQQQIAKNTDIVMEGRDITSRVLPDADLKIYLTASGLVRAKRRHMQLLSQGKDVKFEDVYEDIARRDYLDSNRKSDALTIVDDAWVIDTSDFGIEQVVDVIIGKIRAITAL